MAPWHWYVCTTLLCGTRANPVLSQQYRVAAVEKSPEAIPRAGNTRVCQAVTLIQLFRDQARVLFINSTRRFANHSVFRCCRQVVAVVVALMLISHY